MNPEQWVFLTGLNGVIEIDVVFVLEFARFLSPDGFDVVDYIVAVGVDIFSVLPFLFFARNDRYRQEAAILFQKLVDTRLFKEFLGIVVEVKHYVGASRSLIGFAHFVFRRTVASPKHSLSTFLIRKRMYFHLLRHHECRVETQTEVTDDGIGAILIFGKEFFSTRESDLVDVFIYIFGIHAYTHITHGESACLFVDAYGNLQVAEFTFIFADRWERFELLSGIYGIWNQFTKKNFVVTVQKLFDNGENVVGSYPNSSFWHDFYSFIIFSRLPERHTQAVRHGDAFSAVVINYSFNEAVILSLSTSITKVCPGLASPCSSNSDSGSSMWVCMARLSGRAPYWLS